MYIQIISLIQTYYFNKKYVKTSYSMAQLTNIFHRHCGWALETKFSYAN